MQTEQTATTEQKNINQPDDSTGLGLPGSLPLEDFKKSLGPAAGKYTEEQIERMSAVFDKIADLVFDAWLNKKNAA